RISGFAQARVARIYRLANFPMQVSSRKYVHQQIDEEQRGVPAHIPSSEEKRDKEPGQHQYQSRFLDARRNGICLGVEPSPEQLELRLRSPNPEEYEAAGHQQQGQILIVGERERKLENPLGLLVED